MSTATGRGAKVVIWNGIEYKSASECARANGVKENTMIGRILRGLTCDADVITSNNKPVTWNGVEYLSIQDAATANGITSRGMGARIDKGYTCDSDIKPGATKNKTIFPDGQRFNKPCEWNGVTYKSVTECAKANGLSLAPMSRRIRLGYKSDTDVNLKKSQRRHNPL